MEKYAKSEYVKDIYVESTQYLVQDLTLDDGGGGGSGGVTTHPDVIRSIQYVNNTYYDGDNVNIGMIEMGIPDNLVEDLYYSDIDYYNYNPSLITYHASSVASIMIGEKGIAKDSNLYSAGVGSFTDLAELSQIMTWMLSNDVTVVNLSFGITTMNPGVYGSIDAFMDYLVYNDGVSIVSAAGNYDTGTGDVLTPALGYNIITVGNITNNNTIAGLSSYGELSDDMEKPEISAKGTYDIYEGSILGVSEQSGTSFSAPAVTATIACMMSRRTFLKYRPFLVKSIVTAQSDNNHLVNFNSGQIGYDDKFGAGEINVNQSVNSVYSSSYGSTYPSDPFPSIVKTKSVQLYYGEKITISLWWGVGIDSSQYIKKPTLNLDLKLVHPYYGNICTSQYSDYNFEKITCTIYFSALYDIDIILSEAHTITNNGTSQQFGFAYKIE